MDLQTKKFVVTHRYVTNAMIFKKKIDEAGSGVVPMKYGQGEMETNDHGMRRESNKGRGRFDLLPYEGLEYPAKWFEAGAEKYGERNWEHGGSVKDCINRMCRHAQKVASGWTDEDHLSAVIWNAMVAITTLVRHPECNDHVWHGDITKIYKPTESVKIEWLHNPENILATKNDVRRKF